MYFHIRRRQTNPPSWTWKRFQKQYHQSMFFGRRSWWWRQCLIGPLQRLDVRVVSIPPKPPRPVQIRTMVLAIGARQGLIRKHLSWRTPTPTLAAFSPARAVHLCGQKNRGRFWICHGMNDTRMRPTTARHQIDGGGSPECNPNLVSCDRRSLAIL